MVPGRAGTDDLSVRVLTEMRRHLPLHHRDLLVEGGDHCGQRPDGGGVGGGDGRRLGQLLAAQRGPDRRGLLVDVAAAGTLERRADLGGGQLRRRGRVRGPGQQLESVGGVQVLVGLQRGGEVVPQSVPQPLHLAGPLPDQRLVGAGHHLDRLRPGLSPATGRSWWASVRTMSARMCASAASLLAPEIACRSR